MHRVRSAVGHLSFICLALAFGLSIGAAVAGVPAPVSEATDDDHVSGGLIPPGAPQKPAAAPVNVVKLAVPAKKAPARAKPVPQIVRAFPPPNGETRFRPGEVLVTLTGSMPRANIDAILRRHRLTEAEIAPITLLRTGVRLWRYTDGRTVGGVVRELGGEVEIASAQPNYSYALQQASAPPEPDATQAQALPQYALAKLNISLDAAAQTAKPPAKVLVAVIDTAIDESHPDLTGVIEARFDAIGGDMAARTLSHGTSIAGAIGARGQLKGVAPHVGILSARAFDRDDLGPSGTTLSILKSVDWAANAKARIINMSFAGPADPDMNRVLGAAYGKGLILVGAAGNAGHTSPPLYPAADESVIAVTAIDADDKLYEKANTGSYIAIAAPGVDVLLPSPQGNYDLQSGTSVSAALVSGVIALVLERRPSVQPADMRKLLAATARPLGSADQRALYGAGLIDAGRAMTQTSAALPTQ